MLFIAVCSAKRKKRRVCGLTHIKHIRTDACGKENRIVVEYTDEGKNYSNKRGA